MNNHINTKVGVAGKYKLRVRRADGSTRLETPWFDNLITDVGLNELGVSSNTHAACQVGSGSEPAPATTDTGLISYVAGTTTRSGLTTNAQSTAPYYISATRTYEFGAGVAAGNLTEVGIGTSATSGAGVLFSRALITDGGGSPTTITVLADEFLDVTYQLQVVPPTTDQSFNITDGGAAGTVHAVVMRASEVTQVGGWVHGESTPAGGLAQIRPTTGCTAYDGAIGAITATPVGSSDTAATFTEDAYVGSSLTRTGSAVFSLSRANFATGISAVQIRGLNGAGQWQMSFAPAIPKDDADTLELFFSCVWTRTTAL